jgi:hypothetical protein
MQPSLATPLQLESSPATVHESLLTGLMAPWHPPKLPLKQVCDPKVHDPTSVCPHCLIAPLMHAQPSLGMPLQFASSPCIAHESRGAGETAPWHGPNAPFTQVLMPLWQIPVSVLEPHCTVSPSRQEHPALGLPLQSVSSPAIVHESCSPGPTEPSHAPQSLVRLPSAMMQVRSPDRHWPCPSRPGCSSQGSTLPGTHIHTSSRKLSGSPSQSLSRSELQSRAPVAVQRLGRGPASPRRGAQGPASSSHAEDLLPAALLPAPSGANIPTFLVGSSVLEPAPSEGTAAEVGLGGFVARPASRIDACQTAKSSGSVNDRSFGSQAVDNIPATKLVSNTVALATSNLFVIVICPNPQEYSRESAKLRGVTGPLVTHFARAST